MGTLQQPVAARPSNSSSSLLRQVVYSYGNRHKGPWSLAPQPASRGLGVNPDLVGLSDPLPHSTPPPAACCPDSTTSPSPKSIQSTDVPTYKERKNSAGAGGGSGKLRPGRPFCPGGKDEAFPHASRAHLKRLSLPP